MKWPLGNMQVIKIGEVWGFKNQKTFLKLTQKHQKRPCFGKAQECIKENNRLDQYKDSTKFPAEIK